MAKALPVDEALAVLAATPVQLGDLTAGLSPARLRSAPAEGAWSASEVLAHLRACADVWGGYIERMLEEDHPAIRTMSPRTWIERTDYREQAFTPSLRAFAAQRARLLALLEPLPAEAWSRAATMTGAGRPLELTALSYASEMARHERSHVRQIARTLEVVAG